MTQTSQRGGGPIRLTASSATALRPATAAEITGGLWADRRRVNREVSIPGGWNRLHQAGNFHNLELAAGRATGSYVNDLPFLDSDVYKWLEAVAWALADPVLDSSLADRLRQQLAETERLLRDAQQSDGYLDSHFQVRFPGERFVQLPWGHELYCAGHLIQAAVALHRTTGDPGLLEVARRVADLVVDTFGTEAGKVDGVCGHPEIETALVELYRETGAEPYLERARYFVDRRGTRTTRRWPVWPALLAGPLASPGRRLGRRARGPSALPARRGGRRVPGDRRRQPAPGPGAALGRDGGHQDLPDRGHRGAP